jgi:hypothetical protein
MTFHSFFWSVIIILDIWQLLVPSVLFFCGYTVRDGSVLRNILFVVFRLHHRPRGAFFRSAVGDRLIASSEGPRHALRTAAFWNVQGHDAIDATDRESSPA